MIQRLSIPILAMLGALLLGTAQTQAQDMQDFQCGVPSLAPPLDLDGKELKFDSIKPSMDCKSFLMPNTINYHIYAIPDGDMPRLSMHPEGLVKANVAGNTLELDIQDIMKDLGKSKGDRVQTAVNIFVPVSQLKNVIVQGVNMNLEVTNTIETTDINSMTVEDAGVDNAIYLTSPYSRVFYKGSGISSRVYMETAAGSSINLSGVDQVVNIKTVGDNLKVDMSGVNEKVYVEGGGFDYVSMSGVDTRVYINGGSCNNVDISGVDNSCSLTNDTVTIPRLDCLVSSNFDGGCRGVDDMIKAAVWFSVLVGLVVLVCCCACIGGIVYCAGCRSKNRRGRDDSGATKPQPPAGSLEVQNNNQYGKEQPEKHITVPNGSGGMDKPTVPAVTGLGESCDGINHGGVAGIVEAEIISVEDDRTPHTSASPSHPKGDNMV